MFKLKGIIAVYLLTSISLSAQFFDYGQDPQSLKWFHINTGHFKIVYPEDFSGKANHLANLLEKNYSLTASALQHRPLKIPVIIHNQTVNSNGFVALAPRRMEFFTYPDPDLYCQDWLTELSIHEFRHATQVDKLNRGFTRIFKILTGEQGLGVVAGMLPFWFLEGDAVIAETMLTNAGRGRLPSFEMGIKAHLLTSKKPFSFEKSYMGSYKDYVPDYYQYGFQTVSYGRKTYGEDYWANAIDYVSKHPYTLAPLYFYTKSQTGKSNNALYDNTMDYLKQHWSMTLSTRRIEVNTPINIRKNKVYTSYTHARFLNESIVIALKTGVNIIPEFTTIDKDGKEKKIVSPGTLNSKKFSVNNSKIVWDEVSMDPRWENRSYSILKIHDMKSGATRKLTRHTRFSMPEFSSTGDTLAAIESTPEYEFFLVLISSSGGKILNRISSPGNASLQDPVWIEGSNIAVIAVDDNGKRIMKYNLSDQNWTEIFNSGFINISSLKAQGDNLYFNGSFDGIDNIYSLKLADRTLSKITHSKFGSFYPAISGTGAFMVYSDYSEAGYDMKIKNISQNLFEKFEVPEKITEQSFVSAGDITNNQLLDNTHEDTIMYPIERYSRLAHLFNIHSWSPFYFDYNNPEIDDPQVSPGVTLLSQNLLGTAISSLGYEYRDNTSFFHLNFIYKGLYPVFEVSSVYGGMPYIAINEGETTPVVYSNLKYNILSYIPFKFNAGKFFIGLQPSINLSYNSSYFYYSDIEDYKRGLTFIEPGIYLYTYQRTSIRDIQPRLGITFNLRSINSPFEEELFGSNTSLQSAIYLPGFLKNHGIKIKGEYQNQNPKKYIFNNIINPPRGYSYLPPALSLKKFSGDYVLPLMYPDLSLGPVIYVKRLRASIFADYMNGEEILYPNPSNQPVSYKEFLSEGIEIYADYHLFRFILEFSSGLRISYLHNENEVNYQFLFSINLDKF